MVAYTGHAYGRPEARRRYPNYGMGGGGAEVSTEIAILSHTEASGTDGGGFTSGSRQTRTINTIEYDASSMVSLSANKFTLESGTYEITVSTSIYYCGRVQTWIYNVDDSSETRGQSVYVANNASTGSKYASATAIVVATPTVKQFEIQQRCDTSRLVDGYGVAGSLDAERYLQVEIRRIA